MGFRLIPKSMTLNDLEWRNGRLVCVILPNWVAFGLYYAKVVEDCLLYTSPSPRDRQKSRMPSSA